MYFAEIELQEGNRRVPYVLHDPHTEDSVLHRGRVTHAVNAVSDFRFELLPNHPLFETDLPAYLSWVTVKDADGKIIFRGRVIDLSRQMGTDGMPVKAYVAECEMAYLLDSVQRVRDFRGRTAVTTAEFLRVLLHRHNGRVESEKQFARMQVNREVFPVNSTAHPRPSNPEGLPAHRIEYTTSFENIKENLLDHLGGYIWVEYEGDTRVFCYEDDEEKFWDKRGPMSIALAENLESIRSERVSSRAVTRIVPLGIELNTPENAIRRLVAVGIINNDEGRDGRDYGENVEWWKHNYSRIDPWMFQLLLNISRLNYLRCRGERDGCDHPPCNEPPLPPLFDDAGGRFEDENNIRNPEAFSAAIDRLAGGIWPQQVNAIRNPGYWKQRGRIDLEAEEIAEITDEDERIFLLRLRWLIRKVARGFTKCRPRLHQVEELDARLNLGSPNWIDVDMELALNRLHAAGIVMTTEHWMTQYQARFQRAMSPWSATLIIALSALNYDPALVSEARPAIVAPNTVGSMRETRRAELHEGIDRLAGLGIIHNPDYWKDVAEVASDIAALLWMTGQSVDMRNPRSPYANSSRNLFGTTVEKVLIWDDVTDCDELWERGITWIKNRSLSSSISVSALDLSHLDARYEHFQVGYTYGVENPLLGIGGTESAYRLTGQTIDLLNPLRSTLTFGDRDIAMTSDRSRAH